MKNVNDVEVLVEEFSSVFSNFIKNTKNIYKTVLESTTHNRQQIEIIKYLNYKGKSKMTDIGKELMVSKPYLTALSDKLIESELIIREHDKNDRRIITLDLTEKGVEMVKTYKKIAEEELRKRVAQLSADEVVEMRKMLEAMKNITGSKFFD